jgi:hypothetical protein
VMAVERLRMYLFDVLQQIGWLGVTLAVTGALWLFYTNWRRALLVTGVYAITVVFALGYNVGDVHVFFLPATVMLALLAACGIAGIARVLQNFRGVLGRVLLDPANVALVTIALTGARIYHNYPALDRSHDNRPSALLDALTSGLDDRNAILLTDLNWQIQNGLTYFGSEVRPELAYTRLAEILLYAPALIHDNLAIGRDVVLTDRAKQQLDAAYGPLFRTVADSRISGVTLDDLTRDLPPGTRYVMCILRPTREFAIDANGLARALQRLTGGDAPPVHSDRYAVVAGRTGKAPVLARSSARPFSVSSDLDGVAVEVRMDSWLEFDTIRRMGFGHVIANRNHALIVERGISFVTVDAEGLPIRDGYVAGIFAREGRHLISR